MKRRCIICQQPISIMRLLAIPNALTCCKKCSQRHQQNLRNEGKRRARARKKKEGK